MIDPVWGPGALLLKMHDSPMQKNVTVYQRPILMPSPIPIGEFDSAVMINVLEHIEDDVAALRTLRRLLRPGGRIVLYVPALNGLYGAYDRKVGYFHVVNARDSVREASPSSPSSSVTSTRWPSRPGWCIHTPTSRRTRPAGWRFGIRVGFPNDTPG